ncbi:MAG: SMP-30/gluconolactonase/LRE family protein [Planctomycetaceae bacterium]
MPPRPDTRITPETHVTTFSPLDEMTATRLAGLVIVTGVFMTIPHSGFSAEPAAAESIAAEGAMLEKLAEGFKFTEGPSVDGDGNVYFTDQPNDRIHKWSTDGTVSVFLEPAGRSNGLCFDEDGNLWACADAKNELWKIKPDGSHEVVVDGYDGKLLNGPNDLWIHPAGGIYFTDPFYKRDYWTRGPSEQTKGVYYLSPDRKTLTRVADDLVQPNGIVGTPDGKTLYVADINAKKTYAYDVEAAGSLSNKRLFCEQGSDGMTLDEAGRVYLTGKGVTVYDRDGDKVAQIDVPEPWTANVCFGGKNRSLLFLTAGKRIYGLDTRTSGAARQ